MRPASRAHHPLDSWKIQFYAQTFAEASTSQTFREILSVIEYKVFCWTKGESNSLVFRETWKNFPRYWPFVRGIDQLPVNSDHKGQWRGALMFSLICAWTTGWVYNRDTGDLRRHSVHYDVTVMRRHTGVTTTVLANGLVPSMDEHGLLPR